MKKLRLDVDDIHVVEFEATPGETLDGTVWGQDMLTKSCNGTCIVDSCVTGSVRPCPLCP